MNIDQAIAILELYHREVNIDPPLHFNDALKLSIEALYRVAKMRTFKPDPPGLLLPGETKE